MSSVSLNYDVIVVGAGHAGVEAALAAARMGCKTLLLTGNLDTIGQMSCNPAVGGMAKGQLVREIDALGGEMGLNTDQTGIQFRLLNTRKGPSVWAPRAQCDKKAYQFRLKQVVERQGCLDVHQSMVQQLLHGDGVVLGVLTQTGLEYRAAAVVLTTGTYLRGLIHIGRAKSPGGRAGEPPANELSASLQGAGFELGRLKTGTPPRISRRSIDFGRVQLQLGDEHPRFFSFLTDPLFHVEQLPCYLTSTTGATKAIVHANLHLSAMYAGEITGVGPRYCPSLEDKMVRFPNKERHQVFLEPEGRTTEEFYVNGCSTSLPEAIQYEVIRSIDGLERAEIMRPAYAIEYDYVRPYQLGPGLETRLLRNLFLAGQINGTSGYEEAGAQGIVAGINAALAVRKTEPMVLTRADSYIGVLIDDLITKSTDEPYRMFTSRAEYRLQLRQDNADLRLTPIGRRFGLVDDSRWLTFTVRRAAIDAELQRLHGTREGSTTIADILKRPGVTYAELPGARLSLPADIREQVEVQVKYEGYIARDLERISSFQRLEAKSIPTWLNYDEIQALRFEARQQLRKYRPASLGQASRISGVTPADIAILMVWLKRGESAQRQ